MSRRAPVRGLHIIRDMRPLSDGYMDDGTIPWAIHALAAEAYNQRHEQSAERTAERGGFDWVELVAYLRGETTSEDFVRIENDLARLHRSALRESGQQGAGG